MQAQLNLATKLRFFWQISKFFLSFVVFSLQFRNKMQKNRIFLTNYLHIWKKSSTFAPAFAKKQQ